MSTLDAKLIAHVSDIRKQIAEVEAALPPAAEVLAAKLREAEDAAMRFHLVPFRLPFFGGANAPVERGNVELALLGMGLALNRKGAIAAIEAAVARGCSDGRLRLSEAEKAARLDELRPQLRSAEAVLELARRKLEHDGGEVISRRGYDPATYLLTDADLARIVAGEEPRELEP